MPLIGFILLYAVIWSALLPLRMSLPPEETFTHDASEYHLGGVHLAEIGFYSLDGSTPFFEREPGMSFFLSIVYRFFGTGSRMAIFAMQGLLYLGASLFFCHAFARRTSPRVALFCLGLLLTLPSVFHTIFSAYRENFTLSLLLLFVATLFHLERCPTWPFTLLAGALLGLVILTYIPFLLFPILLLLAWRFLRIPKRFLVTMALLAYVIVFLWGVRNASYTGQMQLTAGERTTWMWYVRGQQAEHLRGLEPLRCLWSEYISRDWTGRSAYCSYNGVLHRYLEEGNTFADTATITREGQMRIMRYAPFYLWFSLFEILELHLPFVNGWGFTYNLLAAVSSMILYLGCALSLSRRMLSVCTPLLLILAYSTAIFILTDATPRYLMPVIFCYAALAALGYDALLKRWLPSSC